MYSKWPVLAGHFSLAATSEELASQAEQLQVTVGFFRVGELETKAGAAIESGKPASTRSGKPGAKKVLTLGSTRKKGSALPAGTRAAVNAGIGLELRGSDQDTEFERF